MAYGFSGHNQAYNQSEILGDLLHNFSSSGSVRVDNTVFSSKGVGNFHFYHRGKEAAFFTRDEASTWNESAIKEEMNRVTNKQYMQLLVEVIIWN